MENVLKSAMMGKISFFKKSYLLITGSSERIFFPKRPKTTKVCDLILSGKIGADNQALAGFPFSFVHEFLI